jgi:DNA primase
VKAEGEDFFDFTLRYLENRHDLTSPGGKARVARSMMKLIGCHQDAIKKALLLKKVADTLGIPEEVMHKEYNASEGPSSPAKRVQGPKEHWVKDRVTITSLEDDLILGLLKEPSLVDEYLDDLKELNTDDEDAAAVLKAICELHALQHKEIKELLTILRDRPNAMERVISLISDPRKTEPRLLVQSAMDTLKKRIHRREYEKIREEGRAVLKAEGAADADRYLKELNRRLKQQKGPGKNRTKEQRE